MNAEPLLAFLITTFHALLGSTVNCIKIISKMCSVFCVDSLIHFFLVLFPCLISCQCFDIPFTSTSWVSCPVDILFLDFTPTKKWSRLQFSLLCDLTSENGNLLKIKTWPTIWLHSLVPGMMHVPRWIFLCGKNALTDLRFIATANWTTHAIITRFTMNPMFTKHILHIFPSKSWHSCLLILSINHYLVYYCTLFVIELVDCYFSSCFGW